MSSNNHGNTPAAWAAVVVCLIGFTIGSIGLMLDPISMAIFWVGVVVALGAGVVFVVMAKMGLHDEIGH